MAVEIELLFYSLSDQNLTHSVLTASFTAEPGLDSCTLNSPSPFIPGLHILLGQA